MKFALRTVVHGSLSLVMAAVILVGMEYVSRLTLSVDRPPALIVEDRPSWLGRQVADPILFWKLAPSWEGEGGLRTNRDGYRGPEITPRASDEFRILSLGASVTFAGRLAYDESYSAVVEERLQAAAPGRALRVINTGVPGWSLFQGVMFYKFHGRAMKPDLVITYFGRNDFSKITVRSNRPGYQTDQFVLTDRELSREQRRLVSRVLRYLKAHSNLVRLVTQTSPDKPTGLVPTARSRVPEADRRELIAELRQMCSEDGVRLVIVVPWYRYFRAHIPVLREIENDQDTFVVDLPLEVEGLDFPQHYFLDRDHLNGRGHALVAKAIEEAIRGHWPELFLRPN